jgi:quercetin 2,3-dioxygenase
LKLLIYRIFSYIYYTTIQTSFSHINKTATMYNKLISNIKPLGFTWHTNDPFLFCVHHLDKYPKGNGQLGPDAPLTGRNLGQDFTIKDGWRMYHGEQIPGFPAHPHRGFETVTVVLKGLIDHSDSHGGAGRYGNGDVQWMTAGKGLQHAEMFPLLNPDEPNPLELFQIWLNLPKASKFVEPHYAMLWAENIPVYSETDHKGLKTEVTIVAGKIKDTSAPPPAPNSWASQKGTEVGIWLIKMEANAQWTVPAASPEVNRSLYFYRGDGIQIAGLLINPYHSVDLLAGEPATIQNNNTDAYLLLLQGQPIAEPVVQHGPFVMNTAAEIQQAFTDYRQTRFGGWPWPTHDNVHPRSSGRFAKHANGKTENP